MTAPKEVKIYAMNKATPEIKESYNPDFIEPAVKKSDFDTEVQALKADLEALVKEIGLEKHWSYYKDFGLADFKVVRKLSQEIGEKWKIKYE